MTTRNFSFPAPRLHLATINNRRGLGAGLLTAARRLLRFPSDYCNHKPSVTRSQRRSQCCRTEVGKRQGCFPSQTPGFLFSPPRQRTSAPTLPLCFIHFFPTIFTVVGRVVRSSHSTIDQVFANIVRSCQYLRHSSSPAPRYPVSSRDTTTTGLSGGRFERLGI